MICQQLADYYLGLTWSEGLVLPEPEPGDYKDFSWLIFSFFSFHYSISVLVRGFSQSGSSSATARP